VPFAAVTLKILLQGAQWVCHGISGTQLLLAH